MSRNPIEECKRATELDGKDNSDKKACIAGPQGCPGPYGNRHACAECQIVRSALADRDEDKDVGRVDE